MKIHKLIENLLSASITPRNEIAFVRDVLVRNWSIILNSLFKLKLRIVGSFAKHELILDVSLIRSVSQQWSILRIVLRNISHP